MGRVRRELASFAMSQRIAAMAALGMVRGRFFKVSQIPAEAGRGKRRKLKRTKNKKRKGNFFFLNKNEKKFFTF